MRPIDEQAPHPRNLTRTPRLSPRTGRIAVTRGRRMLDTVEREGLRTVIGRHRLSDEQAAVSVDSDPVRHSVRQRAHPKPSDFGGPDGGRELGDASIKAKRHSGGGVDAGHLLAALVIVAQIVRDQTL